MPKGRTSFATCGPFLLALMLASCGDRSTPTAEQNRQLDNAAEMLDSAPEILANVNSDMPGDAERNSANSTDESTR